MKNTTYTTEALELNAKLQIKRIKGLRFRVNKVMVVEMNCEYGLYIEGKGFLQWNFKDMPIGGNKKWLTECFLNEGFLHYNDVHFVNPIVK